MEIALWNVGYERKEEGRNDRKKGEGRRERRKEGRNMYIVVCVFVKQSTQLLACWACMIIYTFGELCYVIL